MELLDRYLKSVEPLLPHAERQDILAELSEEIRDEMEERERALGRPLTPAEQEEVLGRFGHPLEVGGRYQPNQGTLTVGRELIGRELFPTYLRALKLLLSITGAVVTVVYAGMAAWQPVTIDGLVRVLALQVVIQGGIVTAVFASLQSTIRKNPGKWDLAKVRPSVSGDTPGAIRFEAIVQFLVLAALWPWLYSAMAIGHVLEGAGVLTPAWHLAYWPVMATTAATMLFSLARLFAPRLARFVGPFNLVGAAVMLATSLYLLSAGPWLTVVNPAKTREIQALNDLVFRNGLICAAAGFGVAVVWEAVKMMRRTKTGHG